MICSQPARGLRKPFEDAVHCLLIGGMDGLGHQNEFSMVSALVWCYTLDRAYGESWLKAIK